jgi:hypothetical protein
VNERLGNVKTNYILTSGNQEIECLSQMLIKNTVTDFISDTKFTLKSTIDFQFITSSELLKIKRSEARKKLKPERVFILLKESLYIEFYDVDGKLLKKFTSFEAGFENNSYNKKELDYVVYSFKIKNFPDILYDRIKRIEIKIVK